jgi:hypothetical protein
MFGHDHQDNEQNETQITLPQVSDLDQGAADGQDQNNGGGTDNQGQDVNNDFGSAPTLPTARKTEKSGAPTDDLLDIKQNALQALTPLVDHLDQSPEERFRTTMMMIQASDNHALIKTAYDAAQQIKDEKERAQALLDIVNEINYFTQQQA